MTQALALRSLLRDAGHRVTGVVMGQSRRREVPAFVREKLDAPLSFIQSPNFVADDAERSVRPWATAFQALRDARTLYGELSRLNDIIAEHRPDVVLNFFEPMAGWTYLRHAPDPPLVCVGHQYMFLHPEYAFPSGRVCNRWMARAFAASTAWRADRYLALSLYPVGEQPLAEPDPGASRLAWDGAGGDGLAATRAARRNGGGPPILGDDFAVMPPLLRDELFEQPLDRTEPFYLVYIVNNGYAEQVIRWHEAHPETRLHCFWDRPNAETGEAYDDTLTFHQLDDAKFLSMMARCRGLVSTAGFESIAEAMYLGKPVQVVPVEGHFEQWCNAFDTVRAGAGIRSRTFDLKRLQQHIFRGSAESRAAYRYASPAPPHTAPKAGVAAASPVGLPTEAFRAWVTAGREQFVREVETAAREGQPDVTMSPPAFASTSEGTESTATESTATESAASASSAPPSS